MGRLFAATASLKAGRTALVEGGRSLTYAELDTRVNRLANLLLGRGIGRGDRVALMARNCIGYLEIELACARIGAIAVGLNWRFTADETAHCLDLTGPSLTIAAPGYEAVLEAAGWPADLVLGEDLEAAMAGAGEGAGEGDPGRHVEPEDGMVVIFTSGTTGHPKGALISHRAIIARALIYGAELAVPADDTFVAWTPLFHMGANDFALATLLRGGRVVVMDGYRPGELIRAIETWPVHYLAAVPGMVEDFVTHLKASSRNFRPIGMVGAMPDLVPRQQLKEITELLNAPYLNTFGSTETGIPPATANFVPVGAAPESLSKVQSGFCEIRLVDADDNDVPDGEPGELAIRGPSLFSGYWGNDEANREAFRNGWFHMGDVFRRNPDGSLDFLDRVKYMIKSGAENIYPGRDRAPHPRRPPHRRRRRGAQARRPLGRGPGRLRRPHRRRAHRRRRDRHVPGEDRQLQAAEGSPFRRDEGSAAEHVGEDPAACAGGAVEVGGINPWPASGRSPPAKAGGRSPGRSSARRGAARRASGG